MVTKPRLFAIATTARVITALLASIGSPVMNDRSIFKYATAGNFRYAIGAYPVPKSSPVAMSSPSSAHDYRCDSGETVVASYPSTNSATVQYKGSTHTLQIAVSASGTRYAGDDLEWWTKGSGAGSEGTLFRHKADSTTGESIERCTAS